MYQPLTQDQYNAALKAGFNPSQIIDMERKRKNEQTVSTASTINPLDTASAEQFKPSFPSKTGQSAITAATKVVGNIPKSAYEFVKGTLGFLNPVNTVKTAQGLGESLAGAQQDIGSNGKIALEILKGLPKAAYQTLTPTLVQNLISGNTEEAERTVVNDPVGQILPLLVVGKQGAKAIGKGEQFDTAMKKISGPVIKTPTKIVNLTGKAVTSGAKFASSQATGLSPKTISQVIEQPSEFTNKKIAEFDRHSLGQEVKIGIDKRLESLSETGKEYQGIREGKFNVKLPKAVFSSILEKYGIKFQQGKILTDKESIPMSGADKTALRDFMNTFEGDQLSGNAFLNARKSLSNMAKYDANKTDASVKLARELRKSLDEQGKTQLPELKELDTKYAPEVELLNQIKRDYLNPDGSFKDGAINKIANLTGVGKNKILSRLEQIIPGVSQKINILKAIEDIHNASGQKVGTYTRAAVSSAGVFTLNPYLIAGAILSSPSIAIQLFRLYGHALKVGSSSLNSIINEYMNNINTIVNISSDLNNFKYPKK